MAVHDERAFQRVIAEELVASGGWVERHHSEVDRDTRLLTDDLVGYLTDTQPDQVEMFRKVAGSQWEAELARIVASDLDREAGRVLPLLRGGKKVRGGVRFQFCQFRPTHDLNVDLVAHYRANRLAVVLEAPVRRHDGHWGAVDVALYVNGIPVADAELKNPNTGQNVKHAVHQYRHERDPRDTLLGRRSVVHFAVDTERVRMATHLEGADTRFLPFDRGSEPDGSGGAGNWQPADGSYPTSYLWRDVWQRDAWLDLLQRFIYVAPQDDGPPTMIFPRYHQWDAVLQLADHAREHGPGHRYLVQHSAGSGKSMTIAWLAHRLTSITPEDATAPVFDKVVVVTDRRVLDAQLSATVRQFEQRSSRGRVVPVDSSRELAEALSRTSAKIVVTTLQKFPFAQQLDTIGGVEGSFAILIDEAHSSQSGDQAKVMKEVLRPGDHGAGEEVAVAADEHALYDDADPLAEAVAASAAARGQRQNLSLFAFTATPKGKTLELFGRQGPDGQFRPFHLYSMRQAIEEEFILDPLEHYTTYETYWKVVTDGGEREVERSKASAAVTKYAQLDPAMVAEKAEIIAEHFRAHVAGRIGGQARAMVVTRSRLAAVRMTRGLRRHIRDTGDEFGVLVAFSGEVTDPTTGERVTEASMNGFSDRQTVRKFATDPYRFLVVAEKYQTGFDQPLLHTMYVDKKLAGVAAVQTLGRLNRIHPGKEHPFVLDFVNTVDDIRDAFEPFYEGAVGTPTDDQILYETWARIEESHILDDDEVDAFAHVWFSSSADEVKGNPKVEAAIRPAAERFRALDDERQEEVRQAVRQFVRVYGFLLQVVDYVDEEFEKVYPYLRILQRRLGGGGGAALDLSEELELSHLKLAANDPSAIQLERGEHVQASFSGTGQGSLTADEQVLLAEVVDELNARFGDMVTEADKVRFVAVGEQFAGDERLQEQAAANDEDTFGYALDDRYAELVMDAMEADAELGKKLLDDTQYARVVKRWLVRYVHRRAAERYDAPELDV